MRSRKIRFAWLVFLVSAIALAGCASFEKKPVARMEPLARFHCMGVSVPPFEWQAADDTLYIEREAEKGLTPSDLILPDGMTVAQVMADVLSRRGVVATTHVADGSLGFKAQVEAARTRGEGCVLLGRVERWQERIGSSWSASRSATVGFKVILVESASGRVLWKGAFEESQQSLSENLLTIKSFVSRKAKWVTAEVLYENGCDALVNSMAEAGGKSKAP